MTNKNKTKTALTEINNLLEQAWMRTYEISRGVPTNSEQWAQVHELLTSIETAQSRVNGVSK